MDQGRFGAIVQLQPLPWDDSIAHTVESCDVRPSGLATAAPRPSVLITGIPTSANKHFSAATGTLAQSDISLRATLPPGSTWLSHVDVLLGHLPPPPTDAPHAPGSNHTVTAGFRCERRATEPRTPGLRSTRRSIA